MQKRDKCARRVTEESSRGACWTYCTQRQQSCPTRLLILALNLIVDRICKNSVSDEMTFTADCNLLHALVSTVQYTLHIRLSLIVYSCITIHATGRTTLLITAELFQCHDRLISKYCVVTGFMSYGSLVRLCLPSLSYAIFEVRG